MQHEYARIYFLTGQRIRVPGLALPRTLDCVMFAGECCMQKKEKPACCSRLLAPRGIEPLFKD